MTEAKRALNTGVTGHSFYYRYILASLILTALGLSIYIGRGREEVRLETTLKHSSLYGVDVGYNFSGVNLHELKILEGINSPLHSKRILVICCRSQGACRGTGDRIRGLVYIASLAVDMGANLTIHPSYAFGVPQVCDSSKPYLRLIDGQDRKKPPEFEDIFRNNDLVQISSNWENPRQGSLLHGWCQSYQCGNLIYHYFVPPSKVLIQSVSFANSFLDTWSRNSTIVLHVRAGGSRIKVGKSSVEAVKWKDGYASDLSNQILAWANSLERNLTCKSPLVVISDSVRFSSELSHLAPVGLQITRCCVSPVHIDHIKGEYNLGASIQQYFDLIVMAKAQKIFSTSGGFSKLGATFLGSMEDKIVACSNLECLDDIPEVLGCD
jgi:hypothetical protein